MSISFRDASRIVSCFLLIGLAAGPSIADDPQPGGRLGRIFRFGAGGTTPSTGSTTPGHDHDVPASAKPSVAMSPSAAYALPPSPSLPPTTPELGPQSAGPRISAQPRVSRPPTEADPLVTRVAICRSTDGSRFASFIQVFADGTVIDGTGIHRVGNDLMKPVVDAMHSGDLFRLKGHCGTPSTDFVESVHLVVYEKSYGKLRAGSFSYSGNPHGCDPAVQKLHTALEALEVKLNSAPASSTVSVAPASTSHAPGAPVLSLSPPSP